MDPDLVGSARLQAEFRQAEIPVTLPDFPMSPRLPAPLGAHRHFLTIFWVPPNGGFNLAFSRNLAPNNADILPKRGMFLELG